MLFWKVFEDLGLGLERTPKIYMEALKRCGNACRGHKRREVVGLQNWKIIEENAHVAGKPIHPQTLKRAHIAMMRTLAV